MRTRPGVARPLLLATALLGLAPGCGKRADPLPPLRITPQPVSELRLGQRADRLVLSLVAPRAGTDGSRLPVLELELLRAEGEGDFTRLARVQTLRAAPGELLRQAEPLPKPGTTLRVAARARARGRVSAQGPIVTFTVQEPPPAPTALSSALSPSGVVLRWVAVVPELPPPPAPAASPSPMAVPAGPAAAGRSPAGVPASPAAASPSPLAIPAPGAASPAPPSVAASPAAASPAAPAGPSPSPAPSATPAPPVRGFLVYRRSREGDFGAPLNATPTLASDYADTSVKPGEDWCYVVRFAASLEPIVEGDGSPVTCILVKDVGAPASPTGVAAVLTAAGIEISWSPSTESDLAGYRVYRHAVGAAPERVAELAPAETRFTDAKPPAGGILVYSVTAFDVAGNESLRSAPLQIRP